MSHHREPVTAVGAPAAIGPYAHAIRAGGLLFCSGQIALHPDSGELVGDGFGEQTAQCLQNLVAVCAAAGAQLRDAVKLTVYVTEMGAFPEVNRACEDFFSSDPPARAVVGVSELPRSARVEIDAVVALPAGRAHRRGASTRVTNPRSALARRVRRQAAACGPHGSPFYAGLLERVATDLEAGGPSWSILEGHHSAGSVPSLRFMGAVHRVVLEGRAPALSRCYAAAREPGAGVSAAEAWPVFRAALEEHQEELRRRVEDPVQTNEAGRCAGLLGGFLVVSRATGLPLRVLEVGASAGLNLRFDHFAYEIDGRVLGDPDSPVRLAPGFEGARPPLDAPLEVAERRGCDPRPLDPASEEARLTLLSYVWPDQAGRFERLEAAIAVARRVPAAVDREGAADWLERQLGGRQAGAATVVFHSIVVQYLDPQERGRVDRVIAQAATAATAHSPLARLAMEPAGELADVRLTLWPGGREQLLARAGYHGAPVRWMMDG